MNYFYWLFALPTGMLASLVIIMTLSGKALSNSTPNWLSLSASAIVLGLLWWSYQLIFVKNHPILAILVVIASWIIFAAIMVGYGLMTTKIWN